MPEKNAAPQLILEAVVTCIEKYGVDKLTTRKIAEQAGTNIASINYYFRSKDELVAAALSMTIKHMMEDIFTALDNTEQPFERTLEDIFFYLLDGGVRFPGVSTAHLYKAIMDKQYDSIGALAMNKSFERLVQRAVQEYPRRNPQELRLRLSLILSSILFNVLAPGFLAVPQKYRLTSSENAKNLAAFYAETFYNQ